MSTVTETPEEKAKRLNRERVQRYRARLNGATAILSPKAAPEPVTQSGSDSERPIYWRDFPGTPAEKEAERIRQIKRAFAPFLPPEGQT